MNHVRFRQNSGIQTWKFQQTILEQAAAGLSWLDRLLLRLVFICYRWFAGVWVTRCFAPLQFLLV